MKPLSTYAGALVLVALAGSAPVLTGCSSSAIGEVSEGDVASTEPSSTTGRPANGVKQISLSYKDTCAAFDDGTIACWGINTSGQLGTGTTSTAASPTPALVTGISNAAIVSAGSDHTCATLADGQVSCWGDDFFGELGNGSRTSSPAPTVVTGLRGVVNLATAQAFTCAANVGGVASCWGTDSFGELGDNGQLTLSSTAVTVPGVSGVIALASGEEHACALVTGGKVTCWGSNDSGQLGSGTSGGQSAPVEVAGVANAVAIAAGLAHTCALEKDGAVLCWGYDAGTAAAGGGSTTAATMPGATSTVNATAVPVASDVMQIAAGGNETCALLRSGRVACWGSNSSGQLGDGTTTDAQAPVLVSGITDAIDVAVGDEHACARLARGSVVCWGANDAGQLGDGTTTDRLTPVQVAGLARLIAMQ